MVAQKQAASVKAGASRPLKAKAANPRSVAKPAEPHPALVDLKIRRSAENAGAVDRGIVRCSPSRDPSFEPTAVRLLPERRIGLTPRAALPRRK
jgi:hypothetical protein